MLSSEARRQAVECASQALSGSISPILAVRQLVSLRRYLEVGEADPDMLCIIALESETDDLPVGAESKVWAIEAPEKRAGEIQRAEEWVLKHGATAFRNVVKRGAPHNNGMKLTGSAKPKLPRPLQLIPVLCYARELGAGAAVTEHRTAGKRSSSRSCTATSDAGPPGG